MPGSGGRRVRVNRRERGTSGDLNRLQSFIAGDLAEILKYLLDARSDYDVTAGGVESVSGTLGNPLRGVVVSGIRPRPEIGTTNLFIEPGVGVFSSPDTAPDADDSAYKWVVDPGVLVGGQLVLTANAAGSARIDVVECQVVDELVSKESREVFDTSIGAFSPATQVEKVRRRRLSYRIRLGTAGAGFPGTAAGWFPLAVASVAAGGTTWNNAVVWDVRQLLADQIFQPLQLDRSLIDWKGKQHVTTTIDATPTPAVVQLRGMVEASIAGRRAGGILDEDAAAGWIDIKNTANHDGSGASIFVANRPWYLWAIFPFGLPRWCRYTPSSAGQRVPGPFRGIPTVSAVGPANMGGAPVSAITVPTALGFAGATTSSAALVVAGLVGTNTARPWGVNVDGAVTWNFMYDAATINAIASTSAADTETWSFVDNTDIPANCRAVHCTMQGLVSSNTLAVRHLLRSRDYTDSFDFLQLEEVVYLKNAGGTHTDRFTKRFPMQSSIKNSPGLKTRKVIWQHDVGAQGGTVTLGKLTIVGWEIGP